MRIKTKQKNRQNETSVCWPLLIKVTFTFTTVGLKYKVLFFSDDFNVLAFVLLSCSTLLYVKKWHFLTIIGKNQPCLAKLNVHLVFDQLLFKG